jgi:SPP1 family predicted phage head-tail adaptor
MTTWLKTAEFNRRITVQKINGYTKVNGDKIPNWVDVFSAWVKVEVNSGREFWTSRKENAEWNGLFKIRYSKDRSVIDTNMQLVYGTRTFNITSVIDPEEAHREIWIEAKEVK